MNQVPGRQTAVEANRANSGVRSAHVQWDFFPATAFASKAALWDRLNEGTFDTPLLSSRFLGDALVHLGRGIEFLAIGSDADVPVAACLLQHRSRLQISSFDAPQLPLCPWLQRPQYPLDALLASLMAALPMRILQLSLLRMDPMKVSKPGPNQRAGPVGHILMGQIKLPEILSDYTKALPKRYQDKVQKRLARAQQALGPVSLDILVEPDAVEAGLREFAFLETSGWKGKEGTAVATGTNQYNFYRSALRGMAAAGETRVLILRLGDRVAAIQLALMRDSRMYLLKSSYDESLRDLSPGVSLKWLMIEAMHKANPSVRRIDMYGKLIESQRPIVTHTRETYHLNFFRTVLLAKMHAFAGRFRERAPN